MNYQNDTWMITNSLILVWCYCKYLIDSMLMLIMILDWPGERLYL